MDKLRMKPRRSKTNKNDIKPPCKRQEKWRQMAYTDFEQLEKIVSKVVERVERSICIYIRTTDEKVAKHAMATLRRNYPTLRDMAHADILDDSCNVLIRMLDILFYPGRNKTMLMSWMKRSMS